MKHPMMDSGWETCLKNKNAIIFFTMLLKPTMLNADSVHS